MPDLDVLQSGLRLESMVGVTGRPALPDMPGEWGHTRLSHTHTPLPVRYTLCMYGVSYREGRVVMETNLSQEYIWCFLQGGRGWFKPDNISAETGVSMAPIALDALQVTNQQIQSCTSPNRMHSMDIFTEFNEPESILFR